MLHSCYHIRLINLRRVTGFGSPCFYHKTYDDSGKQNTHHKTNGEQNNKCHSNNVDTVIIAIIIMCWACWICNHKLCVWRHMLIVNRS